jgi:hypothetical protein
MWQNVSEQCKPLLMQGRGSDGMKGGVLQIIRPETAAVFPLGRFSSTFVLQMMNVVVHKHKLRWFISAGG